MNPTTSLRLARFISLMAAVGMALLIGCGGDETSSTNDECQEDIDCEAANELCIADKCAVVDEPGELSVSTPPPEDVAAGESFQVGFELLDEDGEGLALDGVDVEIELNQHQFAGGDERLEETTDEDGVAGFELSIDEAGADYAITAVTETRGLAELSVTTRTFDVVAGGDSDEFDPEASTIDGEDGVDADGQSEAEVTIELVDVSGAPVSGITPEFAASGEGNEYGDCSATDSQGQSTCSMTSTTAEEKTLEITEPIQTTGSTIEFGSSCAPGASPFGGGDGSDEPYLLCSAEHVNAIAETDGAYGAEFVVDGDIDMSGIDDFNVIGDSGEHFEGIFDGGGHSISNLAIEGSHGEPVGLFGVIGESAQVGNLTVEDVDIDVDMTGNYGVGGLVGQNAGLVIAVAVSGVVEATGASTGGVVGDNSAQGELFEIDAAVEVTAQGGDVGGFVGYNSGEVHFGESTGDVSASQESDDTYAAGGFVGRNDEGGDDSGVVYSSAEADLDVSGANWEVGGFVGVNAATVTNSFATGDIAGAPDRAGGFVGSNRDDGFIFNVYASGDSGNEADAFGGFAAHQYDDPDDESSIHGAFWDTDTSTASQSVGQGLEDPEDDFSSSEDVTGLTTAEFGDPDNFDNLPGTFDFDFVWTIDTASDGEERPILQIEPGDL